MASAKWACVDFCGTLTDGGAGNGTGPNVTDVEWNGLFWN